MEEELCFQGPIGEDGLIEGLRDKLPSKGIYGEFKVLSVGKGRDELYRIELEQNGVIYKGNLPNWAFEFASIAFRENLLLRIDYFKEPLAGNINYVQIVRYRKDSNGAKYE
jgi:hypothetical protein